MPGLGRKLIFLAFANEPPLKSGHLRNLSVESRHLEAILEQNVGAEKKAWLREPHATLDDILSTFRHYRNRIVVFHYGGHANNYQLLFETAEGENAPADALSLANFLAHQAGLHLVFLNACATQGQIEALHRAGVAAVIATDQAVDDAVATEFSSQFYQGLTSGATIKTAFNEAAEAVKAKKGSDFRGLYWGDALSRQLNTVPPPWVLYPPEGPAVDWSLPKPQTLYYGLGSLVGLLLAALITLYFLGVFEPPPLPKGSFNVGVMKFVSLVPDIPAGEADTLSDSFYETLADPEIGVIARSLSEELNSDMPVETRGPDQIGAPQGNNPEAFAAYAAQLAEQQNLTVLIYGFIAQNEQGLYLQPVFFLPENDEQIDFGREIGGANHFGTPLPLKLPLLSGGELTRQNAVLKGRITALGHVILGLRDYSRQRYPEAIADFDRALSPAYWPTNEGKEVVYLLQGATYMGQANTLNPGRLEYRQVLSQAETAFRQAYGLNFRYARPYLGLGGVSLEQAKIISQDGVRIERLDEQKLREAEDWYRGALSRVVTDAPPSAFVPVKAHFGLGRVYRLGYEFTQPPAYDWRDSRRYFEQVITETTGISALDWFKGHALSQLCTLDVLRFVKDKEKVNWATTEQQCVTGIETLENVPHARRALPEYRTRLGFIVAQQPQRNQEACGYYQQAIDEAREYEWPENWLKQVGWAMEEVGCSQ